MKSLRWLALGLLFVAGPSLAFWQSRDSNYNISVGGSIAQTYFPLGVIFESDTGLWTNNTALGVTNTKQHTISFWIHGSWLSNASGYDTLQNMLIVQSYQTSHCEVSGGTAPGICLSLDTSPGHLIFNFNDATGTNTLTDAGKLDGTTGTVFNHPPTYGAWHHYLVSFDTSQVSPAWAVYIDGLNAVTAGYISATAVLPQNLIPDFNGATTTTFGNNGWSTGFTPISGVAGAKTNWLGEVYESNRSVVCTGVGAPYADCAAANTIAPSILARFVNCPGGLANCSIASANAFPVDLGTACATPDGSSADICLRGNGTGFNTNQTSQGGVVTALTTVGTLMNTPYGPGGIKADGQPVLRWWTWGYNGTEPQSVNNNGQIIATGDLLVAVGQWSNSSGNPTPGTCPSTWTLAYSGNDTNSQALVLCYQLQGSGTASNATFTAAFGTGASTRSRMWTLLDYANANTGALFDNSAINCLVNASSSTPKTAALTMNNSNDTLVSIMGAWDHSEALTGPGTGALHYRETQGSTPNIQVNDQIMAASGSTQRTWGISPSAPAIGCSIALNHQ